VEQFLKKNDCDIIKKVGRPVRLTPPAKSQPFTDGGKSVGVGESIGTVFPLLGEGIIPSTWCAELFVQHMHDIRAYRQAVLQKFRIYALVFKFIQLKIAGRFSALNNCLDMLRIYYHMKTNEERYGMNVNIADMLQISKI
jgi:flavin-dependent dehydrogenase